MYVATGDGDGDGAGAGDGVSRTVLLSHRSRQEGSGCRARSLRPPTQALNATCMQRLGSRVRSWIPMRLDKLGSRGKRSYNKPTEINLR